MFLIYVKCPIYLLLEQRGAGKSVCINTIILSILYKSKLDEVKFILIDPKKLELSTYKSLVGYHLITSSNLDEYVMTCREFCSYIKFSYHRNGEKISSFFRC